MVQGVPQGRHVRPKRGNVMIIQGIYRVISESEFSFGGRIQGRGPFLAPGMAPKCFYFLLNDSICTFLRLSCVLGQKLCEY